MRASAVRTAIIDTIEGATVDSKAGSTDRFRVLRQTTEPSSVQERVFTVRLIQGPDKDEANTCDAFLVVYQVSAYYGTSKDIDDKIAADNERLYLPLWNLVDTADILDAQPGPTFVEEGESILIVRRDVRVVFRLDSALL